jgi:hypothetical protein
VGEILPSAGLGPCHVCTAAPGRCRCRVSTAASDRRYAFTQACLWVSLQAPLGHGRPCMYPGTLDTMRETHIAHILKPNLTHIMEICQMFGPKLKTRYIFKYQYLNFIFLGSFKRRQTIYIHLQSINFPNTEQIFYFKTPIKILLHYSGYFQLTIKYRYAINL